MLKEEKYFFFASFFPSAPLLVHTRLIAPLPLTSAVVVVVSILCLFLDFLLSMCSLSERHLGRQCTAEATVLCLCVYVLLHWLHISIGTVQHTHSHTLGKHVLRVGVRQNTFTLSCSAKLMLLQQRRFAVLFRQARVLFLKHHFKLLTAKLFPELCSFLLAPSKCIFLLIVSSTVCVFQLAVA